MKLATIPTAGLAEFVAELARQHRVFYIRTPHDALAKVITRLAEDDVITDGTEDLIVALKRAHVIDAASMVSLLGNYLDEKQAIERALPTIPTSGLGMYIVGLAKRHGVTYAKTPNDSLAEAITNISDDSVEMDDVELLLIALERAGVLPSDAIVPLHINYLREKLNVRPI